MPGTSALRCAPAALVAIGVALAVPTLCSAAPAPGAPGAKTTWTRADKDAFGTAVTPGSKVWFTLSRGELSAAREAGRDRRPCGAPPDDATRARSHRDAHRTAV